MARTAAELLADINLELAEIEHFRQERDALIEQIETLIKYIHNAAAAAGDGDLMNNGTTLIHKIAHVLDVSSGDNGELIASASAVLNERTSLDESEENVIRLESILEKAKYSNRLSKTLRTTLYEILDEARRLKRRAEHK